MLDVGADRGELDARAPAGDAGPPGNRSGDEDEDPPEAAVETPATAWLKHLRRNSSAIVDIFHGQLQSSVRCGVCAATSTAYDAFVFLPLPVSDAPKARLEDCMRLLTQEEPIPEVRVRWRCACEGCRGRGVCLAGGRGSRRHSANFGPTKVNRIVPRHFDVRGHCSRRHW